MKKLLVLLTLALSTTACTEVGHSPSVVDKVKIICIDGVSYVVIKESLGYHGYGYMSVKLDIDSKVVLCGGGK